MNNEPITIAPIAHIHTQFPEKFGIPRQSGLVKELRGTVVFTPPYRNEEALRGMEAFSHLWLVWHFSEAVRKEWSPTVRPPRLGGNTRVGVFATRSPFRPNALGLSCVKLEGVQHGTPEGSVLLVSGVDMLDGTPIFDVKPYIPYADSIPNAVGGFADAVQMHALQVVFPPQWLAQVPEEQREALQGVLANDPRPSYQNDPTRIYGMDFADVCVRFSVQEDVLTVCEVSRKGKRK